MSISAYIDQTELLDFSQRYAIQRPANPLDRFFADEKTESFMAKYYSMTRNSQIPAIASFHALDTEAQIASREVPEVITVEKLLIKRKINQGERLRLAIDHGAFGSTVMKDILFNDFRMLSDAVKDRTIAAKAEVLATGGMKIKENHLDITVDFKVPAEQKVELDWSGTEVDYLGDIQKVIDLAADVGQKITGMITSQKNISKMMRDKNIQTAILGMNGAGAMVSRAQIQALFAEYFGFSEIVVTDEKYKVEKADGSTEMHRYFPDNVVTFYATVNNTVGVGLWGVTPEEEKQGPFTEKSMNQFITLTQYETPDPVTVWTKASGLFLPVLPDPTSLFIATVGTASRTAIQKTTSRKKSEKDTALEVVE